MLFPASDTETPEPVKFNISVFDVITLPPCCTSINVPDVPDEPDEPEVPEVPLLPDVPDEPEEPAAPLLPEVPEVPLLPDVPDEPEEPSPPAAPPKLIHHSAAPPDEVSLVTLIVISPVVLL